MLLWVWCHAPLITSLMSLREENFMLKARLSYNNNTMTIQKEYQKQCYGVLLCLMDGADVQSRGYRLCFHAVKLLFLPCSKPECWNNTRNHNCSPHYVLRPWMNLVCSFCCQLFVNNSMSLTFYLQPVMWNSPLRRICFLSLRTVSWFAFPLLW